jgi:hypothetical protein
MNELLLHYELMRKAQPRVVAFFDELEKISKEKKRERTFSSKEYADKQRSFIRKGQMVSAGAGLFGSIAGTAALTRLPEAKSFGQKFLRAGARTGQVGGFGLLALAGLAALNQDRYDRVRRIVGKSVEGNELSLSEKQQMLMGNPSGSVVPEVAYAYKKRTGKSPGDALERLGDIYMNSDRLLAQSLEKSAKKKKKKEKYLVHKYVGPTLGSAVSGGTMGFALSDKGKRLKGAGKGATAGAIGALLWRLATRGYAKAVNVPFKEVVANAFFAEMEKIAETKAGRRRKLRRGAQALGVGTLGFGAGYAVPKYVYPAMMERLGKPVVLPSNRVAAAAGLLAGLSFATAYGYGKGWANVKPQRLNRREDSTDRAVQSPNGRLAGRHEGHPSEVPAGVLLPAAGGSESVPLRTGGSGREVDDRRSGQRGDNLGPGLDQYRYRRKKARDHHFERSVPVR